MGESRAGQGNVFDMRRIRRLAELMNEYKLAEIDLHDGDQRVRLRRDVDPILAPAAAPVFHTPAAVANTASPTNPPTAAEPAAPADEANITLIKSPMVGTFYQAADPDDPPFVKVGDRVGPDTAIGIVEAMKVFNEIPAECSGTIAAKLIENGDPVEYGQPMFKVDTSQ